MLIHGAFMELTEQKIYSAFGLEPPAAANGAQVQEPAAPAAQGVTAEPAAAASGSGDGVQVQETAAPVTEPAEPGDGMQTEPNAGNAEPGDPALEAGSDTTPGKEVLTPEQRRQNAARRRQEEQQKQQQAIQTAVQQALQAEQEKNAAAMTDFFSRAGLKNSITGEPITSMDEFNAWQRAYSDARLEQDLKQGKLTKEALAQIVAENPVVKQAQEVIRQSQEAEKQAQKAQAKAKIDAEIVEIGKLDPRIQSVNDLLTMENSGEFYALVKQGKSFLEAFKLANFERLTQAKAQAAQQTAMNNARGKDHLTATGNTRGAGMESVPSSEMAMYRLFNPGKSDAEIQAHFNRYKKSV